MLYRLRYDGMHIYCVHMMYGDDIIVLRETGIPSTGGGGGGGYLGEMSTG